MEGQDVNAQFAWVGMAFMALAYTTLSLGLYRH